MFLCFFSALTIAMTLATLVVNHWGNTPEITDSIDTNFKRDMAILFCEYDLFQESDQPQPQLMAVADIFVPYNEFRRLLRD